MRTPYLNIILSFAYDVSACVITTDFDTTNVKRISIFESLVKVDTYCLNDINNKLKEKYQNVIEEIEIKNKNNKLIIRIEKFDGSHIKEEIEISEVDIKDFINSDLNLIMDLLLNIIEKLIENNQK